MFVHHLFLLALPVISAQWLFNRCPIECDCRLMTHIDQLLPSTRAYRTVNCTNRQLLTFPLSEHIPSDTEVLLVARNRIAHLDQRLWLPDLIALDISSNLIQQLPTSQQQFFDGISSLQILAINDNHITSLNDDQFRVLVNLRQLHLANNRLSAIGVDAFRGLSALETLILASNRITYVQPKWWIPLVALNRLSLHANRLVILQSNAFAGLHLDTLDLSDNQLDSVPTLGTLRSSLRSLHIGANRIEALRTDDFIGFDRLKVINAAGMQRLTIVERGAFKNNRVLMRVQLNDCPRLAFIDVRAFVNTPAIDTLHLHNTNLSIVDERMIIDSLPSIETITFYGNPVACDCNNRWLLDRSSQLLQESERMICASPDQHRFKLFTAFNRDQLPIECAPQIRLNSHRRIGDRIEIDCCAIGLPTPSIVWLDTTGKLIRDGDYHTRRRLRNAQTLIIDRITSDDLGVYTCIAESSLGRTSIDLQLEVNIDQLSIFELYTTSNSITIGWHGTDHLGHIFPLLIRRIDTHDHQYMATITSDVTSYTIQHLQSDTVYEACIDVIGDLSCVQVRTRHLSRWQALMNAIAHRRHITIAIGLGICASLSIIVCIAIVYMHRIRQTENFYNHLMESVDLRFVKINARF